jgi:hypothetical protein
MFHFDDKKIKCGAKFLLKIPLGMKILLTKNMEFFNFYLIRQIDTFIYDLFHFTKNQDALQILLDCHLELKNCR